MRFHPFDQIRRQVSDAAAARPVHAEESWPIFPMPPHHEHMQGYAENRRSLGRFQKLLYIHFFLLILEHINGSKPS